MKYSAFSIGLALVIAIGGCNQDKKMAVPQTLSNVSVRTSYDPSAKFPAGGQYAFVQFASDGKQDSEVAMIDQRIRTSLSGELKRKGYKPGEYEEIDFFVVYALGAPSSKSIF